MILCVVIGNNMEINDELQVYRGKDYVISNHIAIHQPTLDEICDFGEQSYYSMIYNLTSTPQSLKWQLWEQNIDYTEISAYELFYRQICYMYPIEKTSIIFGDLDFQKFRAFQRKSDDAVFLYQEIDGYEVFIDEFT